MKRMIAILRVTSCQYCNHEKAHRISPICPMARYAQKLIDDTVVAIEEHSCLFPSLFPLQIPVFSEILERSNHAETNYVNSVDRSLRETNFHVVATCDDFSLHEDWGDFALIGASLREVLGSNALSSHFTPYIFPRIPITGLLIQQY